MKRVFVGLSCLSLLVGAGLRADVLIDYTGPGYSETDIGVTIVGKGSRTLGSIYVGRYDFLIGGTGGTPFASFCLSPLGNLVDPDYYVEVAFNPASPGKNPAGWAESLDGTEKWGIQNAAWLYNKYGASVGSNAEGAGLALAIWEALYDSTGFGKVTADHKTTGKFTWEETDSSATAQANAYLALLTSANVASDLRVGYVYRSTDGNGAFDTTGQDLIVGGPPVPEPSTLVAATLLLLPFGLSTMRLLRKKA